MTYPIKAQPAAAGKQPYGLGLEHIRATADRVSMGKGFVDKQGERHEEDVDYCRSCDASRLIGP